MPSNLNLSLSFKVLVVRIAEFRSPGARTRVVPLKDVSAIGEPVISLLPMNNDMNNEGLSNSKFGRILR